MLVRSHKLLWWVLIRWDEIFIPTLSKWNELFSSVLSVDFWNIMILWRKGVLGVNFSIHRGLTSGLSSASLTLNKSTYWEMLQKMMLLLIEICLIKIISIWYGFLEIMEINWRFKEYLCFRISKNFGKL